MCHLQFLVPLNEFLLHFNPFKQLSLLLSFTSASGLRSCRLAWASWLSGCVLFLDFRSWWLLWLLSVCVCLLQFRCCRLFGFRYWCGFTFIRWRLFTLLLSFQWSLLINLCSRILFVVRSRSGIRSRCNICRTSYVCTAIQFIRILLQQLFLLTVVHVFSTAKACKMWICILSNLVVSLVAPHCVHVTFLNSKSFTLLFFFICISPSEFVVKMFLVTLPLRIYIFWKRCPVIQPLKTILQIDVALG